MTWREKTLPRNARKRPQFPRRGKRVSLAAPIYEELKSDVSGFGEADPDLGKRDAAEKEREEEGESLRWSGSLFIGRRVSEAFESYRNYENA